jgi:hypothetical protein
VPPRCFVWVVVASPRSLWTTGRPSNSIRFVTVASPPPAAEGVSTCVPGMRSCAGGCVRLICVTMRDIQFFQQALGLNHPWRVERSAFHAEDRRLDVYLDFERGATFSCPECGQHGYKVHDTVDKRWRHLKFFQHEAYLHARTPRVRCAKCGVRLVAVPWARPGSGFTLLFEALTMMLAKEMPMVALGRLVGEHDTRLWRTVLHYVDEARAEADFSNVHCVGVDETASKRGHNYISLFVGCRTIEAAVRHRRPQSGDRGRVPQRSGGAWRSGGTDRGVLLGYVAGVHPRHQCIVSERESDVR